MDKLTKTFVIAASSVVIAVGSVQLCVQLDEQFGRYVRYKKCVNDWISSGKDNAKRVKLIRNRCRGWDSY